MITGTSQDSQELTPLPAQVLLDFLFMDARDPWNAEPGLTEEEVRCAVPQTDHYTWPSVLSRAWHAGRVRHIMETPSLMRPIELDIMPGGDLHILDGHHRLYAVALAGEDAIIHAELSGFIDDLPEELII